MKNKRKETTRAAAILLTALLTVNSVDLSGFAVYAKDTKEQTAVQTQNADKAVLTVTDFAELEETIKNQQLAIDALEEEIIFPDTLEVTVSVANAENEEAATETEEAAEPETEEAATETEEAVTETEEAVEPETEEAATETEETTDSETVENESVEAETTETKTGERMSAEPKKEEDSETASIFDGVFSAFAPLTVYAAENHNTETKGAQTKDVTLSGITWELNPSESDGEVFDSSEACDGYCYVYTPILPKTDAEGNTLVLSEEAEIPMLYVLIGEGEHVSLIAEGYDEDGFCEAYEWVKGTLTRKADADCVHEACNGYEPAVKNTDDIYEISNAGQLYWFSEKVNAGDVSINGKLMKDITVNENVLEEDGTLCTSNAAQLRRWIPIGRSAYDCSYTGTFDGNKKTISGLYCNDSETDSNNKFVGLFGSIMSTSDLTYIKDVNVRDSYFSANKYVGGIVGIQDGTVIINCTNSGTCSSKEGYSGGIAGQSNGTITDCTNSGRILSMSMYCGGIVGFSCDNAIKKCTNRGEVTATSLYVGGVAGCLRDSDITDCSNSGNIIGQNHVGGIIGRFYKIEGGENFIKNCLNSGSVTATGSGAVGGIAGSTSKAEIQNCYYLNSLIDLGVGETSDTTGAPEGKDENAFSSGEVAYLLNGSASEGTLAWYQNVDNGKTKDSYPVLDSTHGTVYRSLSACESPTIIKYTNINSKEPWHPSDEKGFCTNCGGYEPAVQITEDNAGSYGFTEEKAETYLGYYAITNAGQLFWFAQEVNAKQGANGGINGVLINDIDLESREWTPIGLFDYWGIFDGQNHTIKNLSITQTRNQMGLFSRMLDGELKNFKVSGAIVLGGDGRNNIGGVVGQASRTKISNVESSVNISKTEAVLDSSRIGGVAGCYVGEINNCRYTGKIEVAIAEYVGGIVGELCSFEGTEGRITNCSNSGSVIGKQYVGGIAGCIEDAWISNSYNIGTVQNGTLSGGIAGAIVGEIGNVKNCYYLKGAAETGIGSGEQGSAAAKTSEEFASGEVAYHLNGEAAEGTLAWYQNVDNGKTKDSYPVLDSTHGTVYASEPCLKMFSNNKANVGHIDHSDFSECEGEDALQYHLCGACGQKVEHSLVFTANDAAATIFGKCSSCQKELGSVTLTAPTGKLIYNTTQRAVSVSGEISGADAPEITYYSVEDNGTETALTGDAKPKDAGTYKASMSCGEGALKVSVSVTYTIAKATPVLQNVSVGDIRNTWTITDEDFEGTNISIPGTFAVKEGEKLQLGTHEYTYVFTPKDTTNYNTVEGKVSITIQDTKAPDIDVALRRQKNGAIIFTCYSFQTQSNDYYYENENLKMELLIADNFSGVKGVWYFVSDTPIFDLTQMENVTDWKEIERRNWPVFQEKGIYYIFVKAMDQGGNTNYISTPGIVLYENSELKQEQVVCTYKGDQDLEIAIANHGNTVDSLELGGAVLTRGTDYTAAEAEGITTITIAASYLNGLKAQEYSYTVSMNPLGVAAPEQKQQKLTGTLVVEPKELSVVKADIRLGEYDSREYNGVTGASVEEVELLGIADGDRVSINSINVTAELSSADAGTYHTVNLFGLELWGEDASNYKLKNTTANAVALEHPVYITKAHAKIKVSKASYTKTFGDASFSLNARSNHYEKAFTYEVTDSKTAEGASTEKNAVITVDSRGNVTIHGAGSAVITIAQEESKNYKAAEPVTINITVNRAVYTGIKTGSRSYYFGKEYRDESVDLRVFLPDNCGIAEYGTPSVSGETNASQFCVQPMVNEDASLMFGLSKLEQDSPSAVSITVPVTTANYEPYSIVVSIERSDCDHVAGEILYTAIGDQAPDCRNAGLGHRECKMCQETVESAIAVLALGHDYVGKVTLMPTVTSTGSKTFTCSRCMDSYTETLPKLQANANSSADSSQTSGGNSQTSGGSSHGKDESSLLDAKNLSVEELTERGSNSVPKLPESLEQMPYIEGASQENGWDIIRGKLETAGTQECITVEMNGTTKVPGMVLEAIKGRDVTVVLNMGEGIAWRINGLDITADSAETIDLGVYTGVQAEASIPVEVRNQVTGERAFVNLTLVHTGTFGFKATLLVNVDSENAGWYANLFYYNPQTQEMEFMSAAQIDKEGNAALEFTHASSYVIVIEKERMDTVLASANEEGEEAMPAKPFDSEEAADIVWTDTEAERAWNPWYLLGIGAFAVIVGIAAVMAGKKKVKEG